jgi:uncharacterized phage protein (TIGR01671 family)
LNIPDDLKNERQEAKMELSREIKFRAFVKDSKESKIGRMTAVSGFCYSPNGLEVEYPKKGFIVNDPDKSHHLFLYQHECVLMQYTGLKDKNDKEIYEGDILQNRADAMWDEEARLYRDFGVVNYDNRDAAFKILSLCAYKVGTRFGGDFLNDGDSFGRTFDFEIIGNICENPELLTKEAKNAWNK